ncbi:MAG: DUF937 domain-containing protein [Saprospiraceae bacterium]
MVNIVDALKGYVTSELVSKAASMLGEDASGITKAAAGLIPTILGGMLSKSTDTGAFGNIFSSLQDKQNDGWMDNLGGLIGGGNLAQNDPKDIAGGLMGSLFGSKVGGILDLISSVAGVKKSSSSGLLGMVAPLVMSYLGRKIRKEGLDAFGLSKFLGGQSANIMGALPAGMGDLVGFAKNAGGNIGNTAKETVSRATSTATKHVENNTGGGNKWLWPLLLAALAAGAFYFMKGCETPEVPSVDVTEQLDKVKDAAGDAAGAVTDAAGSAVDAAGSVVDAAGAVANAAEGAVDAAGNAVGALGAFFKRKLPNGVELNIPENGIESQVVNFITGSNAVDKTSWFNFDRLTFATGKATLDMDKSGEQLKNIAEIMKGYSTLKVKLGGYTDNTGNEAANMTLSQNRADAVKAALVAMGIAGDRIATEGYGIAHPIADNATPEGRAQNRRIALRVDAK